MPFFQQITRRNFQIILLHLTSWRIGDRSSAVNLTQSCALIAENSILPDPLKPPRGHKSAASTCIVNRVPKTGGAVKDILHLEFTALVPLRAQRYSHQNCFNTISRTGICCSNLGATFRGFTWQISAADTVKKCAIDIED